MSVELLSNQIELSNPLKSYERQESERRSHYEVRKSENVPVTNMDGDKRGVGFLKTDRDLKIHYFCVYEVSHVGEAAKELLGVEETLKPPPPKILLSISFINKEKVCDDGSFIVQQIGDSCKLYGFSQVINIRETVKEMLRVERKFFGLQEEETLELYSNDPSKTIRLSTSFNVNREKVCVDRSLIVQQIGDACKRYGSLEGINIREEDMLSIGREIFVLPEEETLKLYSDDPSKTIRLSTSFNVNGRDYHRHHCYPLQKYVPKCPSNPTSFKRFPLDVGANAFRNRPHGGDGSQNGCVELLAVNQADPDSANPNQPASPALNNTPSASDQNATASALPENNGDSNEQPPPDRSPSDMENGEASSQTERRNERTLLNLLEASKVCLVTSGNAGLAWIAIQFTSTKPLSHNDGILLCSAGLCSVAGFFLSSCRYTLQNINRNNHRGEAAAVLLTRTGIVFTACGFISFMGTQFPENIKLWLSGAICVIPISVVPLIF